MFPQIWYHSFKTYTCLVRSIWLKWLWTWLACEAIRCQLVRNLREGKQGISRISGCFVCLHARMVDAGVTVSWGLGKQRSYRHKWHTSIQGFFSSTSNDFAISCNFPVDLQAFQIQLSLESSNLHTFQFVNHSPLNLNFIQQLLSWNLSQLLCNKFPSFSINLFKFLSHLSANFSLEFLFTSIHCQVFTIWSVESFRGRSLRLNFPRGIYEALAYARLCALAHRGGYGSTSVSVIHQRCRPLATGKMAG